MRLNKTILTLLLVLTYPYRFLRDYVQLFLSRRSWKYFRKYMDRDNMHTKKVHDYIFKNQEGNND